MFISIELSYVREGYLTKFRMIATFMTLDTSSISLISMITSIAYKIIMWSMHVISFQRGIERYTCPSNII